MVGEVFEGGFFNMLPTIAGELCVVVCLFWVIQEKGKEKTSADYADYADFLRGLYEKVRR